MEKPITVKQKKDIMQISSGIILILLTFIANGFLSFIVVGFDFSRIWTSEFWASFGILFTSEMCVLFGMFIIQRIKDLSNPKITDLQKHIDTKRNTVYGVDKITPAEDWLRNIYNYRERLNLFEDKIRKLHSKIVLNEPQEGCRFYEFKKKRYEHKKALRDFYVKQFEFIKKDRKKIEILSKQNKTSEDIQNYETLVEELKTNEYAFNKARIHYREVYWGNLLSDIADSSARAGTPFFSEKKELARNIMKYLAMGIITTSFVTALIFPTFKALDWNTALSIIFNLITLTFFMARGIVVSNQIILGSYYKALEKRKSIYNQMLKDLGISKIIIQEDVTDE
jgi:hypothetical protein